MKGKDLKNTPSIVYNFFNFTYGNPVHDDLTSAQHLSPHTSDIWVNQKVQTLKTGWNKKGDSNLNTECPIAALLTDSIILSLVKITYFGNHRGIVSKTGSLT